MNDTNFKQSLREKAENYGMEAPQGLWEDIERSVKGRIFIRRFTKLTAAAAAVALIVGLGIGLTREKPDTESILAETPVSAPLAQTQPSEDSPLLAEAAVETLPKAGTVKKTVRENSAAANPSPEKVRSVPAGNEDGQDGEESAGSAELTQNQTEKLTQGQKEETAKKESAKEEAATPSVQPEKGQLTDTDYYRDAFREDDSGRRRRAGRPSLKLLAANSSSVSLGMGKMMDAAVYSAPAVLLRPVNDGIANDSGEEGGNIYSSDRIGDILIANLNEPVSSEANHHQPLTFGVRVAYPLTDRLAVECGLNYSLLRSDSSYGGSMAYEDKKQSLHYLGIPLSLNYSLLRYRRLDFIVSAGVMTEKCVHGKLVTDHAMNGIKFHDVTKLSVKGLQWSSGVSASLQYNFARSFGLFVEPGLWYRFENRKSGRIRSSYTEEPLNFNLAFGARINI